MHCDARAAEYRRSTPKLVNNQTEERDLCICLNMCLSVWA